MKRLKLFSLILVILMTWTTSIIAAPLTLGDISILPKVIPVNYDTLITVTIQISDPTYIAGSANLYQSDFNQKLIKRLATFRDDGLGGDLVANDGILTAQYHANEIKETTVSLIATAAFKGVILKVMSNPDILDVSADANLSRQKAMTQGDNVVAFKFDGSAAYSVPIKRLVDIVAVNSIDRTTEREIFSEDQSHFGIFTSKSTVPRQSDEILEFSLIGETFKSYDAGTGLIWQIDSTDDKSFYIPNDALIFSKNGDRVALINVGEQNTDAVMAVYTSDGTKLFQSLEIFPSILDAALSSNGDYLGAIVVRDNGISFQVTNVKSGQISESIIDPSQDYFMAVGADKFTLYVNGIASQTLP